MDPQTRDGSTFPSRSMLMVVKGNTEDLSHRFSTTQTLRSSVDFEAESFVAQLKKKCDEYDRHEIEAGSVSPFESFPAGPTSEIDGNVAVDFRKDADEMSIATSASSVIDDGDHVVDDEDELDLQMLSDLAANVIGRNVLFETPFGLKAQCYTDYTASGKAIESIETYIRNEVMPTYGNTHTTTSVTGSQTTSFREEAREIIGKAINARLYGDKRDLIIFSGHGCTSAIHKFIHVLGLNSMRRHRRPHRRPVVFTCPFSHHSNLLPWRELDAVDVVNIPEAKSGGLDVKELECQLRKYQSRDLKIGTFAAASNLTGMLANVDQVSKLLHRYGALSCWDYATCAPYVDINMNPRDPGAYKDAIFFSGHKFVGGPGSPGVLVVKNNLMTNKVPAVRGGGSVLFVTEESHQYLADKVDREEGGTPDILGSIRLGLAFELKQRIGPHHIMNLERHHVHYVRAVLGRNDNIILLGHDNLEQLPIFSFLVRFADRFLHHNFVCALLNDLFGIQARGGCQCAGPFGARLLGLSRDSVNALGHAVVAQDVVLKPGVSRLSFPFFADREEVNYILDAVTFVADHGWKFLPQYEINRHTGVWYHLSRATAPFLTKKSFTSMQLDDELQHQSAAKFSTCDLAAHRRENLDQAATLADACIGKAASADSISDHQKVMPGHEHLRWFVYSHEAVLAFKETGSKPALTGTIEGPCQPLRYFDGAVCDDNLSLSRSKMNLTDFKGFISCKG